MGGVSFNLDFNTIPFHSEEALVEKHYVTKRSYRQKGILAFVVEDAENRVFCYSRPELRKEKQADEILRFVEFWKSRTGKFPEELVFDSKLIRRYAQRMIIENSIADGIEFFHMDALSSAVAMKINCDLQLTLMASSLYRLLGARIGRGYQTVKSQHIFRDFIDATASAHITEYEILVRLQKRAHNPLLIAADFHKADFRVLMHTMAGRQAPAPHLGLRMLEYARVVLSQKTNVGIQASDLNLLALAVRHSENWFLS